MPVIKHLDGVCHVYMDDGADDMAICHRGQCQDPALRHLQYHGDPAGGRLGGGIGCCPRWRGPTPRPGVELRGCDRDRAILPGMAATEQDWREEYLAPILAVRVVDGLDAAIDHINTYSSLHTDSIVTRDHGSAMRFPAGGGFQLRHGQRLHPFRRRLRIRPGRRDRYFHRQAARPRPVGWRA